MRTQLVLTAALLTALGCGSSSDKGGGGKVEQISDHDADIFGKVLLKALHPCDPATLAPLVDGDGMIQRAVDQVHVDVATARQLISGAHEAPNGGIIGELCAAFDTDGATYKLLRVQHLDGRTYLLVRRLAGAAVNYYRFELGALPSGQVIARDLYVFLSGATVSESMAEIYRTGGVGITSVEEAHHVVDAMSQMRNAFAAQDWAGARQIIAELPPSLQHAKSIMLMDCQAAMHQSGDEYARCLTAFATQFPDDPAELLMALDALYQQRDFNALLVAISKLDKQVDDPYLAVMRAGTLLERRGAGDLQQADKLVVDAIKREPDLEKLYFTRIDINLAMNDFATVREVMQQMVEKFGTPFNEASMNASPAWAGFMASPELETWRTYAEGRGMTP